MEKQNGRTRTPVPLQMSFIPNFATAHLSILLRTWQNPGSKSSLLSLVLGSLSDMLQQHHKYSVTTHTSFQIHHSQTVTQQTASVLLARVSGVLKQFPHNFPYAAI